MSNDNTFRVIQDWWILHPKTNRNHIALLCALSIFIKRKGADTCFPSQESLGKIIDASRATVNKYIRELVEMGIIRKTKRFRYNDATSSCVYTLISSKEENDLYLAGGNLPEATFELPEDADPEETQPAEKNDEISGVNDLTGGVKNLDSKKEESKKINSMDRFHSDEEVASWQPSATTVRQIQELMPDCDIEGYAASFRRKILKHGYQYRDLDDAIYLWFRQDLAKKKVPAKKASFSQKAVKKLQESLKAKDPALEGVLARLTSMLPKTEVANWFADLKLASRGDQGVVLQCKSRFIRDVIERDHMEALTVALSREGVLMPGCRPRLVEAAMS